MKREELKEKRVKEIKAQLLKLAQAASPGEEIMLSIPIGDSAFGNLAAVEAIEENLDILKGKKIGLIHEGAKQFESLLRLEKLLVAHAAVVGGVNFVAQMIKKDPNVILREIVSTSLARVKGKDKSEAVMISLNIVSAMIGKVLGTLNLPAIKSHKISLIDSSLYGWLNLTEQEREDARAELKKEFPFAFKEESGFRRRWAVPQNKKRKK